MFFVLYFIIETSEVNSQVWWPILGIRALHLTHPKRAHTQQGTHTPWTHTRSSEQSFMLWRPGSSCGFGDFLKGTSVVVLKVEWALDIHSPHLQFLPARDSNSQPLDYESDSLTIRPRLPQIFIIHNTVLKLNEFPSSVKPKTRYFEECASHYFWCCNVPFVNPFFLFLRL